MTNSVTFPRSVRDYQIRVNSLGLGVVLKVDGMNGPNTQKGIALAMKAMGVQTKDAIFDPSGITRLHWHWTASGYKVNSEIASHYNDVFDKDGNHYDGGAPAQQQAFYIPGRVGVSHTFNGNTGAIGLAVAAMRGASYKGTTVDSGDSPLNWKMIDAMLERSAEYCRAFDIRVSPWTTITHCEVQTNIGIKQKWKWDIRVNPDKPTRLLGEKEMGDILRKRMMEKFF